MFVCCVDYYCHDFCLNLRSFVSVVYSVCTVGDGHPVPHSPLCRTSELEIVMTDLERANQVQSYGVARCIDPCRVYVCSVRVLFVGISYS